MPFGSQPLFTRPELVRWSVCAAVVLAAHGLAALVLAGGSNEAEPESGAPVVTVELAPVAVAPPTPPRDLAAGPLLETDSQERVAEEAPAPPERKEPEKDKQEKVVEAPPAPDPEVAMAPEPPPEEGPIDYKPAPVQALAAHAALIISAGRPPCPMCGGPIDHDGGVCPRLNGHH